KAEPGPALEIIDGIISRIKSSLHEINLEHASADTPPSSDDPGFMETPLEHAFADTPPSSDDPGSMETPPEHALAHTPPPYDVPGFMEMQLPGGTDFKDNPREAPKKLSPGGLNHPGTLPSYLDMDDFGEFLSMQKNTLDKMETLILDIEKNRNLEFAQGELKRLFHTTKGEAGFLGLTDVENICHRAEDMMGTQGFERSVDVLLAIKDWLFDTFMLYAGQGTSPLPPENIIEFMEKLETESGIMDMEKGTVQGPDNGNQPDSIPPGPGESIDVEKGAAQRPDSRNQPDSIPPGPGESIDVEKGAAQRPDSRKQPDSSPSKLAESINVDASRLDRLVEIIGEIAIAESMVTQSPEVIRNASPELMRALGSLHKTTRALQTLGLSLRMVSLKSTFSRMERVVRDLSKKTGKIIRFTMTGETTELDKNLVDRLGDPLIHIVRNSVDHGIEPSSSERVKVGKAETAAIEMRAFHKGGFLYIEVQDDGRGIDHRRIFEKAVTMGIIPGNTRANDMDRESLLNLVFHPGLSTAKKVTGVSGRGVGMDVVKKSIEACKGRVSITSVKGRGTICTIKLPLTLSIIDGLVVRVADQTYIIPALSVVTSMKIEKNRLSNVFETGEMIRVADGLIPLFRLTRLFNMEEGNGEKPPWEGIIVIVEEGGIKTALLGDELLGKQSTVIKSLGSGMENIQGISGATIMPDGRVSLILDIGGIVELSKGNY
ncbi:MAG: chemotaxis protein CheA, partial [Desulfamplus sp.]|nr:chemotaxis protein CheA [Desulfamplus sp.]